MAAFGPGVVPPPLPQKQRGNSKKKKKKQVRKRVYVCVCLLLSERGVRRKREDRKTGWGEKVGDDESNELNSVRFIGNH